MSKVFISYARDESCGQNLASETQAQLEDAGISVFRDATGLKGGDFWLHKLEDELRTSDVVVLILSKKVLVSKWVPNEISLAEELAIPVIPIYAEHIQLPLWIRHLQVIDFVSVTPWMKLHGAIISQIALSHLPKVSATIETLKVKADLKYRSHEAKKHALRWANRSGKDQYGQYADLGIDDAVQRFRLIKPGYFRMGSLESEKNRESGIAKETPHRVTLSRDFWLADTTCTQMFWKSIMGNNPAHFKDNESNPVESISWNDAQEFIKILNNMKLGVSFCLPTEARWEYACRAETKTPFSFGENITPDQVNYNGSFSYGSGKEITNRKKPVPVKSLAPNAWGLYEMHGNVWEWCEDAYQEVLGNEARTDPVYESGVGRVVRGGSWFSNGKETRSASRRYFSPDLSNRNIGLRLCLITSAKRLG